MADTTAATPAKPALGLGDVLEGDLFEILGLTGLPEEQQDSLRLMVMESIRDRVLLRIVKELGPAKEPDWLSLLDRDAPQSELENYLTEAGVDLPSLIAEETFAYKIELAERLGLVAKDA